MKGKTTEQLIKNEIKEIKKCKDPVLAIAKVLRLTVIASSIGLIYRKLAKNV